jgi:hypothetical protein
MSADVQLEHVQFIVMREGDSMIALVTASVPETLATEEALREALRETITVWMNETVDGRRAYRETGGGFSLVDFPSFANATLLIRLVKQGIIDFRVDLITAQNSGEWVLDDPLFFPARIDDSK